MYVYLLYVYSLYVYSLYVRKHCHMLVHISFSSKYLLLRFHSQKSIQTLDKYTYL